MGAALSRNLSWARVAKPPPLRLPGSTLGHGAVLHGRRHAATDSPPSSAAWQRPRRLPGPRRGQMLGAERDGPPRARPSCDHSDPSARYGRAERPTTRIAVPGRRDTTTSSRANEACGMTATQPTPGVQARSPQDTRADVTSSTPNAPQHVGTSSTTGFGGFWCRNPQPNTQHPVVEGCRRAATTWDATT